MRAIASLLALAAIAFPLAAHAGDTPSPKTAKAFFVNLKNGDQVDGFVVKEGGDSVEVRNLVGTSTVIEKGDITERHKLEQSIMPEGLVANLTPSELASLLAFLESTAAK